MRQQTDNLYAVKGFGFFFLLSDMQKHWLKQVIQQIGKQKLKTTAGSQRNLHTSLEHAREVVDAPSPDVIQGQAGWGFEQSGLADVPAYSRGLELDDL